MGTIGMVATSERFDATLTSFQEAKTMDEATCVEQVVAFMASPYMTLDVEESETATVVDESQVRLVSTTMQGLRRYYTLEEVLERRGEFLQYADWKFEFTFYEGAY